MAILDRDERGTGAMIRPSQFTQDESVARRGSSGKVVLASGLDNPPPAGRVELLTWRFANGLDLFTGDPLTDADMACNDDGIDDE